MHNGLTTFSYVYYFFLKKFFKLKYLDYTRIYMIYLYSDTAEMIQSLNNATFFCEIYIGVKVQPKLVIAGFP